ncbi:DUF952 domain-containing protein [Bernardetia sp. OM2101]|uniref:DUF952 domain-containing protein n=1 Tax=Bernardetia sp. OM2101 TaxID=3344876 RepID=UPI0035CED0F3
MAIPPNYINESKHLMRVRPEQLDVLWKDGWRHFGTHFYRYSWALYDDVLCMVVPLRVDLEGYKHSKRFKKILSKNKHFRTVIEPIALTTEHHVLFDKHKQKFSHTIPQDIYVFLSRQPDKIPNPTYQINIYDTEREGKTSPVDKGRGKLIACSFFDIGNESISSVYGMYDSDYSSNSLGIYSMLMEIEYAKEQQKNYYYHGYSYDLPSMYDYKKTFPNIQAYDWERWQHPKNIFANPLPKRFYHLVKLSDWDLDHYQDTQIRPPGEFIHCSYSEQVARSANKYFAEEESVLVLHIAPERVHSLIKDEYAPDGLLFPHIYGYIPRMAIFRMTEISKNKNGVFEFDETIDDEFYE